MSNYIHYRFNEECSEKTTLATVEKMLNEIKKLPRGEAWLRVSPRIERSKEFEGGIKTVVRARISVLPFPVCWDDVSIWGFGLYPREMVEGDL